ncbi:hypothetical protein C461_10523 [Halorubrum aidingense JCM 13560]|uniref:Uncharacterized protein n=1 Tax=Halorubrum aidingense JCM 13560 TaxID=1230454 RepID=M0P9G8_9EURY|nr:DUF5812 family protein [Halorubrum aidingense]EMA66468.1 hypothetical protein C461_10523 [Halorubrum aidingense JCM 13560]
MTDDAGTEKESTFLVTHVESDSAVLKDVHDGQVHTLGSNPDLDVDDAVEATVAPEPPMEVTYRVVEVTERRSLSIEESEEPPTVHERELAAETPTGELAREPRAGIGEIHVLTPPESETEQAVADVVDDREGTLSRAARLGVNRVEIRSDPGIVSVRYMP